MLVVAATIGASGPAAAAGISVTVTPQTGAPIQLLTCTSQKTRVEIARGVSVDGFQTGVTFKNTSQKVARRVIFKFTMRDATGGEIDSHTESSSGTYVAGVEIDNIGWQTVNSWPTLADMDCAVDAVTFQDGTSWAAGDDAIRAS